VLQSSDAMIHRLLLLLLVMSATAEARPLEPELEPGDVVIHWKSGGPRSSESRVGSLPVQEQRELTPRASLLRLAVRTRRATRQAIAALSQDPRVALAEPNFIRRPFRVPDDTHYKLQWNIRAARLEQAWDQLTGNPNVVVAVVDTGLYPGHPDLANRTVQGYDFISDPANAGDNNGWDADPKDEGNDTLASSAFHGTHVAGIIGAASNNKMGIVGVDWACKIQPVRALGIQQGKGKDADIAAAIRWAAGVAVPNAPQNPTPARVINLSFGGPGASYLLSDAIRDAQQKGAIVVAAAGNHGGSVENIYPAVVPDVVTVGATDLNNKRAPYSNYGSEVDIMAPGGNMLQKLPFQYQNKDWYAGVLGTLYSASDKKYIYMPFEGTSQASPLVAGVVSLMLKINPTLNSKETIALLKKSANAAFQCKEGCGAGLIDAAAALTATKGGPTGATTGEKLPFSYKCTSDTECAGGMCRQVAGYQICTQPCSSAAPCPNGAVCVGGFCAPTSAPPDYSPGVPSTGQSLTAGTVWGGGCAVGSTPTSGPPFLALALLGLLFFRRRARH